MTPSPPYNDPERWFYRLNFAVMGLFVGLGVWVLNYPFEEWSVTLFGLAFYATQIAGVVSGLVVIFTQVEVTPSADTRHER